LSSLASWQATRRGKGEDGTASDLSERVFRRRRAGTEFEPLRVAEGQALALATGAKGADARGLDVTVLGCGLPYGSGEGPLLGMLEEAWRCQSDATAAAGAKRGTVEWAGRSNAEARVTVASPMLGRNFVPTVHVLDAAAVIAGVALGGQPGPADEEEAANAAAAAAMAGTGRASYLVVADRGRASLRQIGAAVARAVGTGGIRIADTAEAVAREDTWRAADLAAADGCKMGGWLGLMASDLSFDQGASASFEVLSGSVTGGWRSPDADEEDDGAADAAPEAVGEAVEWRCGDGLLGAAPLVASEFVRARGLRPVSAVVVGPVGSGCEAVASAIASKWRAPVVTAESAVAALRAAVEVEEPAEPTPEASAEEAAKAAEAAAKAAERGARAAARAEDDDDDDAAAARAAAEDEEQEEEEAGAEDGEKPAWLEEPDTAGVAARAGARKLLQRVELTLKAKGSIGRKLGARVIRWWLSQAITRNRGWVLSGYPRGRAECEELVRERGDGEDEEEDDAAVERLKDAEDAGEGDDDVYGVETGDVTTEGDDDAGAGAGAEEDEDDVPVSKWLVPAVVVCLDGADDRLVEAAQRGGEGLTGLTEEAAQARVAAWRRLNTAGGSVRSAGGFLSRHGRVEAIEAVLEHAKPATAEEAASAPAEAEAGGGSEESKTAEDGIAASVPSTPEAVVALTDPLLAATLAPQRGPGSAAYLEAAGVEVACPLWLGGAPCNFHPTPEEKEAELAAAEARAARESAEARRGEEEEAARETALHTARQSQVEARKKRIAEQEAELLAARSRPLREWLGSEVLPALSRGLLEAVKAKPDDPVDFLAEFLLAEAAAEGETEAGTLA
jgi:hypothetical protein